MCIYVCGLSWQSFLFRETINPPLIIGLTYPHLAYKSWYYTHTHTHTRELLEDMALLTTSLSVLIGRFCCHGKSKHPDEKRLHFGNGHRK